MSDQKAITTNKTPRRTIHKKHKPKAALRRKERLFALDIGTRSVIGIVAEKTASGLKIIDTARLEHTTRAMLDGQIHDVPQVAAIISKVKNALAKHTGVLHHAAVAAAGRALYTMTAEAEMEINGLITKEQERSLDFAGVQAAQTKLASSDAVDDPTRYYCVGYSTVKYILDDNQLKTLVGQRGRLAKATVIATFLPRQVIDSMQSALHEAKLDMQALTLEPIAAINVLIPPTMRHLNLVLVDIGAGTSDIAITKNGSVIAYGMVPLAGDEITEAISQKYLLDFNIAEQIKRNAADGQDSSFTDILGTTYTLSPQDIIDPVLPNIKNLADEIAKQILELNGEAPQAVLLVGGGSLTPQLQKHVADALALPPARVAVRHPESIEGLEEIPPELRLPDAVTPLGILKIASLSTLHFFTIYVNDEEFSLFNFRDLTVSDALLNAGIQLKKFNGRPGLGLMLTISGKNKFIPGTMGTLAHLKLEGEDAGLDTPISEGCHITIEPGENGQIPDITLADVIEAPVEYTIYINGREKHLPPHLTINGQPADGTQKLSDGDTIAAAEPRSLGEALLAAGYSPTGKKIKFHLNDSDSQYTITPEILLNDNPASISMPIHEMDHIEYNAADAPKLGEVLNISEMDASLIIYFNKAEYKIPSASLKLSMNDRPASIGTLLEEGCHVKCVRSERTATTVSNALLAVGFKPPAPASRATFTININGQEADFTSPIKNGDALDVIIKPYEAKNGETELPAADTASASPSIPGMPKKNNTAWTPAK